MASDKPAQTNESNETVEEKKYHRPVVEDFGDARDLTKGNTGTGTDGAPFDGADSGLDGAGTAS